MDCCPHAGLQFNVNFYRWTPPQIAFGQTYIIDLCDNQPPYDQVCHSLFSHNTAAQTCTDPLQWLITQYLNAALPDWLTCACWLATDLAYLPRPSPLILPVR